MSDEEREIPIHCGWCGMELADLGEDHICEKGVRVSRALATRDIEVLLDE